MINLIHPTDKGQKQLSASRTWDQTQLSIKRERLQFEPKWAKREVKSQMDQDITEQKWQRILL